MIITSLPIYIEQRYCLDCVCVHWLEVAGWEGREICHGIELSPTETPPNTHTRRSGRGYEILPDLHAPIQEELLPIEWQMRIDAEEV